MRIRARLRPKVVPRTDADVEVDVGLGAQVDVVVGVDGPARRAAGGRELEHVAEVGIVRETLSATLQHVARELAVQGLRHVLGARTGVIREIPLALLRVVDLELESLARREGGGIDTTRRSAAGVIWTDRYHAHLRARKATVRRDLKCIARVLLPMAAETRQTESKSGHGPFKYLLDSRPLGSAEHAC